MMEIVEGLDQRHHRSLLSLYHSVGWHAYTRDEESLLRAYENSSYVVVALHQDEVIGVARSLSDDVSIHYLQDILVRPTHQGQGIGKKLIAKTFERYAHVRTHLLLTDNEERQAKFYESVGLSNLRKYKQGALNVFIQQA